VLARDSAVLPATHTFVQSGISLPLLPDDRTSLHFWLVLISHPIEGRRLSWPAWLGEILRWFISQRWSPIPQRWEIELVTIESQVKCLNQKTDPPAVQETL